MRKENIRNHRDTANPADITLTLTSGEVTHTVMMKIVLEVERWYQQQRSGHGKGLLLVPAYEGGQASGMVGG